jgi:hypothetical protein
MKPDPGELSALVEHASARNASADVTGMLWFDEVNFVQVLEGEHAAVGETVERIRADRRHTAVDLICDRPVGHRMFGAWGMTVPDAGPEATASTAFLIGFARHENTPAARRVFEIVMASEG